MGVHAVLGSDTETAAWDHAVYKEHAIMPDVREFIRGEVKRPALQRRPKINTLKK
jgi:hypothetical protein